MIPDVFTILKNSCHTGYKNQIKGRFLILQTLLFTELLWSESVTCKRQVLS
jgi:hypothetical protein